MEKAENKPAVLVVGGGIGGMKAALDLAEMGIQVYLVEKRGSLGGAISQLDKQFPTDSCGLCQMLPYFGSRDCSYRYCLRTSFNHPDIKTFPYAELEGLEGEVGDFSLTIRSKATYVDQERCVQCGECLDACPVEVTDEFNQGLTRRKAIYTRYPQSTPPIYTIDLSACTRCGLCEKACPAGAIDFGQKDKIQKLEVGAVILALGFEIFDPRGLGEFGYGRLPNVITSIELERILSAAGPYGGSLRWLSDSSLLRRIAFLQCIGSRDRGQPYCSSVCCMYATKEALLIKKIRRDAECQIFFMDMRTCGKGYEEYYRKAQGEIIYTRCRPSAVEKVPGSEGLRIRYEGENGRLLAKEFDLVVLSVGLGPSVEARRLSEICGVGLNPYGFSKNGDLSGVETTRPGIFVCGAFSEPKDIPETITEAGEAAMRAAEPLLPTEKRAFTKGPAVSGEAKALDFEVRIGVFLCSCGSSISRVIELERLAQRMKIEDDVHWVEVKPFLCQEEGQGRIKRAILEGNLNRVIIAACTERLYGSLFRRVLQEAGLDLQCLEMVNIREQCAWVHLREPAQATEKALDLILAAAAKAGLEKPTLHISKAIERRALVIGGGLSGLTAGLSLALQGIETHLVEREPELGGNLRKIHFILEGGDPQRVLRKAIAEAEGHPFLRIHKNAEVKSLLGSAGAFEATILLKDRGDELILGFGAIIVATGAREYRPTEYLYGEDPRVITQLELEERLHSPQSPVPSPQSIVMIQCVGSREEGRPYCSRVCCSQAIKNAIKMKELNPSSRVYILYRDMRTYGFKEVSYKKARELGVIFIRYEPGEKPEVRKEGDAFKVLVREPLLDMTLEIPADLLALSTGITPPENGDLAKLLQVDLDNNGFYCEANVKFRPVDFIREGIFLCGLAHSPRLVEESISQARAAAARAAALLSRDEVESLPIVADIKERWCTGCGICVNICPFQARELDEEGRVARVAQSLCRGCGACAVACPSGTSQQRGFEKRQILAMVEAML